MRLENALSVCLIDWDKGKRKGTFLGWPMVQMEIDGEW